METAFLNKGKPKALRVQAGDAELGIRAFIGRLGKDHNHFNIDVLRAREWPAPDSKVELGMGGVIAERLVKPSAEAQSRADQIIAAFDQWQKIDKEKKPQRLLTAERQRDECDDRVQALKERIAEMPAATIEGMIAKARCANICGEEYLPACDDALSIFRASIVRDLLAVAGTKPTGAGTQPKPKTSIDPVFSLIDAHRKAQAAWSASLDELARLEKMQDCVDDSFTDAPCKGWPLYLYGRSRSCGYHATRPSRQDSISAGNRAKQRGLDV
jgi:hypothetical protein